MQKADILTLFDYTYWARDRLLAVAEAMPRELYVRDVGSSHGGVHGTLVHTTGAEEIWLKRWKGESPSVILRPEDVPGFDALRDRWAMVQHGIMGFCHMLKEDRDLDRVIEYRDIRGNAYAQPLGTLMQHLANHSTYHRGQAAGIMRQLGIKPAPTDMVAFFRERAQSPPAG